MTLPAEYRRLLEHLLSEEFHGRDALRAQLDYCELKRAVAPDVWPYWIDVTVSDDAVPVSYDGTIAVHVPVEAHYRNADISRALGFGDDAGLIVLALQVREGKITGVEQIDSIPPEYLPNPRPDISEYALLIREWTFTDRVQP